MCVVCVAFLTKRPLFAWLDTLLTRQPMLHPSTNRNVRMDVSTINIVGTKIRPIIFVKVEVQPEQSMANIMVERVELEGSDAVRSAGGSFNGAIV